MGIYPQVDMPVEEIQWDKHDVVECDDRGRATLGTEYAEERVMIYVAELPDPNHLERPSDETRDVLGSMLKWARERDIDTMTNLLDPETGIVTDKNGETYQTPYSLE